MSLGAANSTRTFGSENDTGSFERGSRSYLPEAPPGYQLLSRLGCGGMGTVYQAREYATERIVAIKFLHFPSSGSAFDRFLVEVRALSRLDHPNVIKVLTVDATWREPFVTMELADRGTLADLARAEKLPAPEEAARLILGAAEGVDYAHGRNVLHRDIKPSNVLLKSSEEAQRTGQTEGSLCPPGVVIPKVSDFGLAKRTDRDDGLTRTGPLGTPSFMSPEAAAGLYRTIGAPADVYGLGATLYFVLTGQAPFTGEDSNEIIQKVLTQEPVRPRAIRSEIPEELEAIVVKAMEKDPGARYATVAELADDLRRFLAGQAPAAPLQSPLRRARRWLRRNRKRVAATVGVMLAAVALVAAGSLLMPSPDPVPPAPDPLETIRTDLAAGKTVTLIGETGLPKYHRFWLEPAAIGQRETDGTCEFGAMSVCMLELAPNLKLDHYRVELELRHLLARPPAPVSEAKEKVGMVPPRIDTDSVAFYFGHSFAAFGGNAVHAMFLVEYRDFEPPARLTPRAKTRAVNLIGAGYGASADAPLEHLARTRLRGIPFTPKPGNLPPLRQESGDWRPIVVDFTSEGVHVQWRADRKQPDEAPRMVTVAQKTPLEMHQYYRDVKTAIDGKVPGARDLLPDWSPQMPFGVLSTKSRVAVRNVKITPLP